MKRGLKIILIACLLLLVFMAAACDKPKVTPTPAKNDTQLWKKNWDLDFKGRTFRVFNSAWGDEKYFNRDDLEATRRKILLDDLKSEYNGDIELVGKADMPSYEAVVSSIMAGAPMADAMDGGPHTFLEHMRKQLIIPLDDYASAFELENGDRWEQDVQKFYNVAGKQWVVVPKYTGWLLAGQSRLVFFNKDLLISSGVTDDLYKLQANKQWTWDKFAEISLKVTKDTNGDGKTDIWGAGGNGHSLLMGFIASNGGSMFGPDENGYPTFTMDKQPARQAFQFLVDMCVKDKSFRPRPDEEGSSIDVPLFNKGKMGFTCEFVNRIDPNIGGFSNLKDDFGILMYPLAPNKTDYKVPLEFYAGMRIIKGAPEPEEIAKFLTYFFSPVYTQDESEEMFNTASEYLRDEQSLETMAMVKGRTSLDQGGYYCIGGTDGDSLFLVIDGSEPTFRGETTIQQFYDEIKPLIMDRLSKCWDSILK